MEQNSRTSSATELGIPTPHNHHGKTDHLAHLPAPDVGKSDEERAEIVCALQPYVSHHTPDSNMQY